MIQTQDERAWNFCSTKNTYAAEKMFYNDIMNANENSYDNMNALNDMIRGWGYSDSPSTPVLGKPEYLTGYEAASHRMGSYIAPAQEININNDTIETWAKLETAFRGPTSPIVTAVPDIKSDCLTQDMCPPRRRRVNDFSHSYDENGDMATAIGVASSPLVCSGGYMTSAGYCVGGHTILDAQDQAADVLWHNQVTCEKAKVKNQNVISERKSKFGSNNMPSRSKDQELLETFDYILSFLATGKKKVIGNNMHISSGDGNVNKIFVSIVRAGCLVTLMKNVSGSRNIQKLLPRLNKRTSKCLIDHLEGQAAHLLMDKYGCYSMLAFMYHSDLCDNIYQEILDNVVSIAQNKQGCCSLQKLFDIAPMRVKTAFLKAMVVNAKALLQDYYANYVIQYMMDVEHQCGSNRMTIQLFNAIKNDLPMYVSNKHSSCVLEKILLYGNSEIRSHFSSYFTKAKVEGVRRHMINAYSNYVLQTALDLTTDETQLVILLQGLMTAFHGKKKLSCGRLVTAKLDRKYEILVQSDSSIGHLRKYCKQLSTLRKQSTNEELMKGVFLTSSCSGSSCSTGTG